MKQTTLKLIAAAALIAGSMQPAFAKTISKEFSESVTVERTVVNKSLGGGWSMGVSEMSVTYDWENSRWASLAGHERIQDTQIR